MRSDILVKVFAMVLVLAGAVVAWLIWLIWDTLFSELAQTYPFFAIFGVFIFAILCLPQIIGGALAWRFGTVSRGMAVDIAARERDHIVLRVFMGIFGLILAGVVGLSGFTLALDFGFSGLCGIVLVVLAAVGPQKVAGVA